MSKFRDIFTLKKKRHGPVDINNAINFLHQKNKHLPSSAKGIAKELSREMKVNITEDQVADAIYPTAQQLEEDARLIYKHAL